MSREDVGGRGSRLAMRRAPSAALRPDRPVLAPPPLRGGGQDPSLFSPPPPKVGEGARAKLGWEGGGLGAWITKMRAGPWVPERSSSGRGRPGSQNREDETRRESRVSSLGSVATDVYDPVFEPFDSARSLILSLAVTRPCPAARRTFAVDRSAVAVARWRFSFVRTLSKAVLSWS